MSRTTTLISSSTYDGRTMKLTCTQTTNGSSANTSTINWTLTASGGQHKYDTGPTTVEIAGVQRYYKARTSWSSGQFPAAPGSVNGEFTLSHKQDGSIDPIELSLATAIFSTWVQTDRKTFELESIARYFSNTPTLTLKGRTETSLTFDWKTSETCSSVIAHIGGKTQTLAVNGTSGSFTVSGLTVNTAYSTYGEFTRKDSGLKSNSATISYSTYNYPYITAISKPKLKIGEEQVITVFNPLGRSVKVRATNNSAGTSGIYAETTITGTSATLSPEANLLYAAIPNSQTGTIYYNCFYNDSMTNNKTGNFEILGTETPTFNGTRFSFMDSNIDVTDITAQGENGWLVQGLSILKVTLDELAVGNNGANISKYDVTIAGDTIEIPGSIGSNVSFANLNLSGEQTLSIKVTDSRGLVTTGTKTVIFKPYSSPTISLIAKRENNYGEDVKINTYFSSSSVEGLNGIKVSWSGASQSGYLKGSSTTFDETQSTSAEIDITGVDNSNPYVFSATIIDKFGRISSSQSNISIGVPTMFIDYEQNGVGVNCFPEGEGIWTSSKNGGGLFIDGKPATGVKTYDFNLEDMSNELFYPMIFSSSDNMVNICHFSVGSSSLGAAEPYNNNVITGWGRGGGWSDLASGYHIQHIKFDKDENIFLSFGKGSKSFYGIYLYVRGGLRYRVHTLADSVILSTEDITINSSFFPAGVSDLSTASNINSFISKDSFDGDYLKKEYISGDTEITGDLTLNSGIANLERLNLKKSEDLFGQDANNLFGRVVIGYGYNMSNIPVGISGYLINIPHSRLQYTYSNNKQICLPESGNDVYTRDMGSGVWGAWKQVGGEPSLIEISKNVNLQNANTWYDTGITGNDLLSGTYIFEVYIDIHGTDIYNERISGTIAWHGETTNGVPANEIPLSQAGHASNGHDFKLRFKREGDNAYGKLQILDSTAWRTSGNLEFKFKRII